MKSKFIAKIFVDIMMTAALLFLMTYELIGQAVHEWIGIVIFILFIVHHILNGKWSKNILKGKYTPLRTLQTVIVILVLLSMLGAMISGVILSRHALAFLSISGGHSFARTLHMLSVYWGFVLMSLHLGIHWNMMVSAARKFVKKSSEIYKWILRIFVVIIFGYGMYAFIKRDIGSYMFLKNQFVFFDFEEPLFFFILDYIAIMGFFICIGHYIGVLLKLKYKSSKGQKKL